MFILYCCADAEAVRAEARAAGVDHIGAGGALQEDTGIASTFL